MESVMDQTYEGAIEHIVAIDGSAAAIAYANLGQAKRLYYKASKHEKDRRLLLNYLPIPYGKDRWNGHRIYGGFTHLSDGEYLIYLDDDNYLEPTHVADCLRVIEEGSTWSFAFRNIVSQDGTFLCKDDCESLGIYPSILHPQDFFIDVNCYFLPRKVAMAISPVWFCKFREPGQPEIDRRIAFALRQNFPNYDSTYKYTVNYAMGGSGLSVQPDFFLQGNAAMLARYNGVLPWKKQ